MAAVMQTVGLGITRVSTFAGMPSAPADLLPVEECAPHFAGQPSNAVLMLEKECIHVLGPMVAADGRFPGVHGSRPLVPATAEL